MHVDQSRASGIKEKINGLRLGHSAITGEGQGVGSVDTCIVATTDQRFKLGNDTWAPDTGLLDLDHLVFEKPFVN